MNKQNKRLHQIIFGAILLLIAFLFSAHETIAFAFFIAGYLIAGGNVLYKAARNIAHGKIFDENFLMAVATIGAFFIGEYPEAVAVMLFYQIGELFQSYAVSKSRHSIVELMNIRPDYANLKRGDTIQQVDPEAVQVGDVIVVRPGEKIPLDGIVKSGSSTVDTSALTGESIPAALQPGSEALSGCINLNGLLEIEVSREFSASTVSKILDLVEHASSKKSRFENFITRFAAIYTPIVVFSAAALAILPPLFLPGAAFSVWLYRALSFLVVSCPCALVISVPLSFFGGIGGASKNGILVKGSNYLEALARTEIAVFDKTGTLTKGSFAVQAIRPVSMPPEALLQYAAFAEGFSTHPISHSLQRAYGKAIDQQAVSNVRELPGYGVSAMVDGHMVLAGNQKWMEKNQIAYTPSDDADTILYLAVDNTYAGNIVIADEIKPDSVLAVSSLREQGIQTVMLTGDAEKAAKKTAETLHIDAVYAQLLPAGKVSRVEELLQRQKKGGTLLFVGDGINDAPVLARADIGIAMGGLGSDAAIEAADIVLMTDEPSKVSEAIAISRHTLSIVRQNIVFAIGVKILVLILCALGYASMWWAVFADVGVAVLAILNSFRALSYGGKMQRANRLVQKHPEQGSAGI